MAEPRRIAAIVRTPALRTAYRRGAAFERQVKAHLEQGGGVVIRSAGSHSPADLLWLSAGFPQSYAIQCKHASGMTRKERVAFYGWCETAGVLPLLITKVRGGFRVERVAALGDLVAWAL